MEILLIWEPRISGMRALPVVKYLGFLYFLRLCMLSSFPMVYGCSGRMLKFVWMMEAKSHGSLLLFMLAPVSLGGQSYGST